MTETNQSVFYAIGRAYMKERPEEFIALKSKLDQLENQAMDSIDLLPALFEIFCSITGNAPGNISTKAKRSTMEVVNQRRLFIAISYYLFDPIYFRDYSARTRDRLRERTSKVLNCHEIWVSNIANSVKFEYQHINTFQMQVNIIAYYLRKQVESSKNFQVG